MFETFSYTTEIEIASNHQIQITLPENIPPGPAKVSITISTGHAKTINTLGDLLRSEFFGMWQDRVDIDDSVNFARQLRKEAWKRVQ